MSDEETRGLCSVCGKSVQLIYERVNVMGRKLIGPHSVPLSPMIVNSRYQECAGVGHLPKPHTSHQTEEFEKVARE